MARQVMYVDHTNIKPAVYVYIRMKGEFGESADTVHVYNTLITYYNEHFIDTHTLAGVYEETPYPDVDHTRLAARPMGSALVNSLKAGDVLMALHADSVFTSSRNAMDTIARLYMEGIHLVVCDMGIDSTTVRGQYKMQALVELSALLQSTFAWKRSRRLIDPNNKNPLFGTTQRALATRDAARRLYLMRQRGLRWRTIARRLWYARSNEPDQAGGRANVPQAYISRARRLVSWYREWLES